MVNRSRRGSLLSTVSDTFFTLDDDDGMSVGWASEAESLKPSGNYVTPYISRTDNNDESWFSEAGTSSSMTEHDEPVEVKTSSLPPRRVSDEELRDMFARTAGFFSEFEESDAEETPKSKSPRGSAKNSKRRPRKVSPKPQTTSSMETCLQFDTTEASRIAAELTDLESDALLSEIGTDVENERQARRQRRLKIKDSDAKRDKRKRRSPRKEREAHDLYGGESEVDTDREESSYHRRLLRHSSHHRISSKQPEDFDTDRDSPYRKRSGRQAEKHAHQRVFHDSEIDTDRETSRHRRSSRRTPGAARSPTNKHGDRSKRERSERSKHGGSERSPNKDPDSKQEKSEHRRHSRRVSSTIVDRKLKRQSSKRSTRGDGYESSASQSDRGEVIKPSGVRRGSLLGSIQFDESTSELDFSKHSQSNSSRRCAMDKSISRMSNRDLSKATSPTSMTGDALQPSSSKHRRESMKSHVVSKKGHGSKRHMEATKRRSPVAQTVNPNTIVQNVKRKYGQNIDYPTDTEDETSRMDDSIRSRRRSIQHAWKEKEQLKSKAHSGLEDSGPTQPVDPEKENHRREILDQSRKGPVRASSRLRERNDPLLADNLLGDDLGSESEREVVEPTTRRRLSLDPGFGEDNLYGSIDQLIDNRRNRTRRSPNNAQARGSGLENSQQIRQLKETLDPHNPSRHLSGEISSPGKGDKARKSPHNKDAHSYDKSVDELLKARRLRGANQRTKALQKEEAKKFNPMEMLAGSNLFK